MNPPIKPRRRLHRLALLSASCLIAALALPAYSSASPASSHGVRAVRAEERAAQAEERASRRESERALRAQEREAARDARGEASSDASETGSGQTPSETARAPSAPAPPPAQLERGCRASIQASSLRIDAGATVVLSGTLECPLSTSAGDQQLPIYERQGQGSFSLLGTATTEADGAYELTSGALSENTVFQARAGRHRARAAVKVGPGVTLAIVPAGTPATTTANQSRAQARTRATFTGTVSPAVTGALVALQVAYAASGERWRSVAYTHVNAEGNYAIAHTFKTPGMASVRTLVHLGRHYAPAVSAALAFEVPQPQNPQLSIGASIDPLVYGQSVTISGVAPAAAGEPVTLLARTGSGAFVEVEKGTTEANGDYTFTQTPLQSTYYRVSSGSEQSSTLFEGVAYALTSTPPAATALSGQLVTFSGTVSPAAAGQVGYGLKLNRTRRVRLFA